MFDKTVDEKREELEPLYGSEVWQWYDADVVDEYDQLWADGMSLVESDFSNIDEVDDEFDRKYKDWE